MKKQVYYVRSEIAESIRDNGNKVKTLGGIYIKKSQLTFDDYIKRVSTAGTIVDELMICLLSQMYKIHSGLILQDRKVWTTYQLDDVQAITIWVTCAHSFFYNLTVP